MNLSRTMAAKVRSGTVGRPLFFNPASAAALKYLSTKGSSVAGSSRMAAIFASSGSGWKSSSGRKGIHNWPWAYLRLSRTSTESHLEAILPYLDGLVDGWM